MSYKPQKHLIEELRGQNPSQGLVYGRPKNLVPRHLAQREELQLNESGFPKVPRSYAPKAEITSDLQQSIISELGLSSEEDPFEKRPIVKYPSKASGKTQINTEEKLSNEDKEPITQPKPQVQPQSQSPQSQAPKITPPVNAPPITSNKKPQSSNFGNSNISTPFGVPSSKKKEYLPSSLEGKILDFENNKNNILNYINYDIITNISKIIEKDKSNEIITKEIRDFYIYKK